MRGRVLRTDVHNIFFVSEEYQFFILYCTIRVKFQFGSGINGFFIVHTKRIVLFRIIVLTHRVSYPVVTQVEAAHVGMSNEDDAVEIVYFTLQEICCFPDVTDTG